MPRTTRQSYFDYIHAWKAAMLEALAMKATQ
jgi:hypothetical protein